jgi:hypothetical protein
MGWEKWKQKDLFLQQSARVCTLSRQHVSWGGFAMHGPAVHSNKACVSLCMWHAWRKHLGLEFVSEFVSTSTYQHCARLRIFLCTHQHLIEFLRLPPDQIIDR